MTESKKPYDSLGDAIDNPKTRWEYVSGVRLFMKLYEVTEYDELLKVTTEQTEDKIIQDILSIKKKVLFDG